MTREIIYTNNKTMNEKIRRKHLIPYQINSPDIKYETNRWYYNDYWGSYFKVLRVKYNKYNILEECEVMWEDGNYGLICTDLELYRDYRLDKDHNNLHTQDIINSGKIYTGAEIIYWFFMNNINCFNPKYKGFWKFIDTYSKHRIYDYNKYKIVADLNGKQCYTNCRIIRINR